MQRIAPLSCLVAAILAGCVLLDPTDPYQHVPSRPRPRPHAVVTSQPAGCLDKPLTLDQAVAIAIENNPEIAASRWDVETASARRSIAFGEALPSFHAVGGYSHTIIPQRLTPVVTPGEAGVGTRDIFSGDLVLSMPLFTGGRILSRIKAAELVELAAEHQLARTHEELVFNVSSVFFTILAQEHVVASLAFSISTLERHVHQVEDLIGQGKAAKVDLLRTQVRLADLTQKKAQASGTLAIHHRVLANLMGVDDQYETLHVKGRLSVDSEAEMADVETFVAQAWDNRDDYLAARAALEAQARNLDAARAGHWPTVAFRGSYGGRWAVNPTTQPAGARMSEEVGQLGVVMDIPVFDGGRIDAQRREERSKLNAAMERLRKLQLQIRLEVEMAVVTMKTAHQRVKATEAAIQQAEESLRIEREKYELGKGAIVDVLDAQSALLESQTSYYQAMADYNVALAQLNLAIGEP
ncbi:MAG: TolC family protein [Phycisphaerae bacterium]|nr:TolC family protein [Phycisphaerae bacterium]